MTSAPRLASTFFLLATVVALGCSATEASDAAVGSSDDTADDSSSADDGLTDSSAASTTTSAAATDSETADEPTDTKAIADDAADDDDTAGFLVPPDGGVATAGTCFGISSTGNLATVHAMDGTTAPGEATCAPQPKTCGGNVVGSWTVEEHCGLEDLPNFLADQCPESTLTVLDSTLTGSRTYGEDLTFEREFSSEIDLQITLDAMDCYGISCEAFGQLLNDQDNNLIGMCADDEPSGCLCPLMLVSDNYSTGTYEQTEAGIVHSANGQDGEPTPVCLDADGQLTFWDPLTNSQSFPQVGCDAAEDCQRRLGDAHDQWLCL